MKIGTAVRRVAHDSSVPTKYSRLKELSRTITDAREEALDLGELIMQDIQNGWTTGEHEAVDFALVASNGVYDANIIDEYRALAEIPDRNAGKRMLVVQEADCIYEDCLIPLRTIHIATLRQSAIKFDVHHETIHLPVHPGYFMWQETWSSAGIVTGEYTMCSDTITTGPLLTNLSTYSNAYEMETGVFAAPTNASGRIYVHPWDSDMLDDEHGIGADLYRYLADSWILLRNGR